MAQMYEASNHAFQLVLPIYHQYREYKKIAIVYSKLATIMSKIDDSYANKVFVLHDWAATRIF